MFDLENMKKKYIIKTLSTKKEKSLKSYFDLLESNDKNVIKDKIQTAVGFLSNVSVDGWYEVSSNYYFFETKKECLEAIENNINYEKNNGLYLPSFTSRNYEIVEVYV